MKFKLAKKYSLVLTFVMVFSFFEPTIVSARAYQHSDIDIIGDYGWMENSNSKICDDSVHGVVWTDNCDFVNKKTDTSVRSKREVCNVLELNDKRVNLYDLKKEIKGGLTDSRKQVGQKKMKSYAIIKKNETDSNNSNNDEDVNDENSTDAEDDNEYGKDAKNLDDNKKMSNENINKMGIDKDLNDQSRKEDESNAYAKKNFSKEDIDRGDHVVEFSLNLGDDTDIYDQQRVKNGDVAKQIADPEKAEYTFGGWYYDTDCSGKPYNFNDPVLRNFTVYAKWIKKEQIFKMKLSKNLIPSKENNDITKLFQINRNVSSRLNNRPVKPRNSIARFRRLGNAKPKNANNISRFLSKNIDVFNNYKEKEDVNIKDERPFSDDLYLHNPKTGDIGIIIWIGFMSVSVLGTSYVVKLLKKEK